MKRRIVVSHADWDGVLSSLYTIPRPSEMIVVDYYQLDSVPRDSPRVFFEVHKPEIVMHSDVIVDHHMPKLPGIPVKGLTGYVSVVEENGARLVAVSSAPGMDYSNVRGVQRLYTHPEFRRLFPSALRPSERVARISDVLDNPLLASRSEVPVVLGYTLSWQRLIPHIVAAMRSAAAAGRLDEAAEKMAKVFYEAGSMAMEPIRTLETSMRPLLIVAEPEGEPYAKLLLLHHELSEKLERPLYILASRIPGTNRYKLLMISPDKTALELAERLGGGGRPLPTGGTVAGADTRLEELQRILEHKFRNIDRIVVKRQPLELEHAIATVRKRIRELKLTELKNATPTPA